VPSPALQRGRVLVRSVASLISAGTERMAVELVSKGLVKEARERPDSGKGGCRKSKKRRFAEHLCLGPRQDGSFNSAWL
jgi:hypothetical protein